MEERELRDLERVFGTERTKLHRLRDIIHEWVQGISPTVQGVIAIDGKTLRRSHDSLVRLGHADENLAVLRHSSLNLLRQEKSSRIGIHAKRLMVGWENDYLQRVLDGVN